MCLSKMSFFLLKILKLPSLSIFKQRNIWVFGSWKGEKYNDNSKALFEYAQNKKDVRPIWITKSDKVCGYLTKNGYECYKFYSLKGIYFCLIAKVVVISVSYFDVSPFAYLFPWKLKIIQLWHGTPLKCLEDKIFSKVQNIITKLLKKYFGRSFDILISGTNLNKKIYSELFGIKEEKIKITGQPRNDLMFIERSLKEEINLDKQKTILYLPTWREYDSNHDLFFQYGFDVHVMNEFLKRIDAILLIKFHVNESTKGKFFPNEEKIERINFINIDDIYEILGKVDILITDYSSIYFDFLLLDRPIIFSPFDLETYEKERGFYYNYEDVTPGPKAKNWDEIINNIQEVLENDFYKEKKKLVNKQFNFWNDGKSSERVFQEILKLIK